MEQQENTENSGSPENPTNFSEKDSAKDEAADLSPLADSEKADNLPVESIGSYARIDELLDGEGTEKQGEGSSI